MNRFDMNTYAKTSLPVAMLLALLFTTLPAAAQGVPADAVVVVILPDHGTRYLGKIYNDNWMKDHHFVDKGNMLTAAEIVERKSEKMPLSTLSRHNTLNDAIHVMRDTYITQIPVVENGIPFL